MPVFGDTINKKCFKIIVVKLCIFVQWRFKMKYSAIVVGILITLLAGVYVIAFTPFGNDMLKPIIEQKINEEAKLNSKLNKFQLTMSSIDIILELDKENILYINGDYSLLASSFDLTYKVELNKLQNLKELTKSPAQGKFHTNGTIKGDEEFMVINGVSDVASSDTTYHVELREYNPTSIIAKVKDADLVSLLKLGGQKPYANGAVNLDMNFKNITPHALDGDVVLNTQNGQLNVALMKKDFEINIPQTAFAMNLNATLKGDDVNYGYVLSSNLAKVTSSGKVTPQPLKTDIKYNIDVDELAVLQPITGADIRGALKLNGTVKGTKEKMTVVGKSDIASSNTSFEAILKEFKPATAKVDVKDLKLAKLLYMVRQPHYTDGVLSLNADISDARMGSLKGVVNSKIREGVLDSSYLTKAYKFKTTMPRTEFKLDTTSTLNGNIVDTKVDVTSTLANFNIKNAKVNINDSSVVSDYTATIPTLDKLYFVTERHLRGGVSVNGELKKAKDLDLTALSKIAGGDVSAKLHNDNFHADLKSLQTLDILNILIYPEMFKSSLNGVLDYNLANQKGNMKAQLSDGKFTQNQVLNLVKQYAKVDMYAQTFKGDLNADINKENILASLDLKSNTSSIKTKNTKLNSKTKRIDSKIEVIANNNTPLTITLKGNAKAPQVGIDAQKLIKQEATKAIQKEVGNLIKGLF